MPGVPPAAGSPVRMPGVPAGRRVPGRLEHDRLGRRHRAGEVTAGHRRLGGDQLTRPRLRHGRGIEDPPGHRARIANVAHQRARVDAGDRGDAAVGQPLTPPGLGAGSGLTIDRLAHDRRAGVDPVGLHRRLHHPVVSDLREAEDDQLPGVAGVGHRLLVAGHRGREHELADRGSVGADAEPVELGAVSKQHVPLARAHRRASLRSPSAESVPATSIGWRCTTAPPATVNSTRPRRRMPSNEQFADLLA